MRRRYGWWSALALLLALVIGCAAQAPPARDAPAAPGAAAPPGAPAPSAPAPAAQPAAALPPLPAPLKVRVGSGSNIADAPIYVALDRGYFTEAGVEIEDLRFAAVSGMMAPLAAGQLDVVSAVVSAGMFNAFARDIDVRMVADKGILAPGFGYSGLVVRRDLWESGAIRSLADLRGRKVGLAGATAGSSVTMLLGHALEAQGMSLADLDVVDVTLPDTNAALGNRLLDAAMQVDPLLTLGAASGLFTVLHRSDELYPNQQNAFILYSADFARSQPEAGRRWMVAYLRGVREYVDAFIKGHGRDEVAAIMARMTPVKDLALYHQMVPAYVDPNGRLNIRTLVEAQDWYAANGFVPQKVDVAALADYQFLDYAIGLLGEYR
jgi:NitT/TauT family transport system substrate-binding protein